MSGKQLDLEEEANKSEISGLGKIPQEPTYPPNPPLTQQDFKEMMKVLEAPREPRKIEMPQPLTEEGQKALDEALDEFIEKPEPKERMSSFRPRVAGQKKFRKPNKFTPKKPKRR